MKKYEIRHKVIMEEVFEVSFADDDNENDDKPSSDGNNIKWNFRSVVSRLIY